jgi:hypothetical protein
MLGFQRWCFIFFGRNDLWTYLFRPGDIKVRENSWSLLSVENYSRWMSKLLWFDNIVTKNNVWNPLEQ